jgi:hypothetical protein
MLVGKFVKKQLFGELKRGEGKTSGKWVTK